MPANVNHALTSAKVVVLYSLQPTAEPDRQKGNFHQFQVLGQVQLRNGPAKQAIGAFRQAAISVEALLWDSNAPCNCVMEPRYALRVYHDKGYYDLLLAYESGEMDVYADDHLITPIFHLNGTPEILNSLLINAKIPLAH